MTPHNVTKISVILKHSTHTHTHTDEPTAHSHIYTVFFVLFFITCNTIAFYYSDFRTKSKLL